MTFIFHFQNGSQSFFSVCSWCIICIRLPTLIWWIYFSNSLVKEYQGVSVFWLKSMYADFVWVYGTDRQTGGWTDATKRIISLASRPIMKVSSCSVNENLFIEQGVSNGATWVWNLPVDSMIFHSVWLLVDYLQHNQFDWEVW